MANPRTGRYGVSSDLKILVAAVLIGVLSVLMVSAGLAGHLNISQLIDTLSFWSEMAAGGAIFITIVAYTPLALSEMRDRR